MYLLSYEINDSDSKKCNEETFNQDLIDVFY